MNRYQGQYQEMRNYFDEIRAQVEVKPYEEVELRTIMSSLNKAGMDRAGDHISYPMLQRKDIFQSTKNEQFYLSKGACFPPYIEFSVLDREQPRRKNRTYEIIIPAKEEACDMISILLIDFLLEHGICAEVKASTIPTNANIRVFVETEEMATMIRDYCLKQPLLYLSVTKPNPFVNRFGKEVDGKEALFGYHKNPYGAGMESVEYISVLIHEYVEAARTHGRIDFITVDKFMSSLRKRIDKYREQDPKKEESQNLLSVFNKAKENFEQEVKTKIVLTKQKGKRDIIPSSSFGKPEKTYQRPTYIS